MSGFGRSRPVLMMPATAPCYATEFAFVFAMWAVMMVGMMTPSAMPMIHPRKSLAGLSGGRFPRKLETEENLDEFDLSTIDS